MFEKITKKEFLDTLKKDGSVLLGSWMNLDTDKSIKVMQGLYNFNQEIDVKDLKVASKIQSNALMFSNGSWLYYSSIKESLKHNNVIVSFEERYDTYDKDFRYDIIAYAIVKF